ncbi:MAG: CvpA family protein, partial [Acidobacteria bacterium]|nr:CvpA family protein [Acidobacteriota bacterium]
MNFNWFDIVLLIFIGVALIIGVIKGLVRQIVGITSIFVGLFLAMGYYSQPSAVFMRFTKNNMVADLLGFLAIFFGLLILGGLVSWALSKFMKGPLKFVNHTLGAALGLIEGILICGVLVLAQMIFPV